jgi:adenine/guanine/hypoxanthine permease
VGRRGRLDRYVWCPDHAFRCADGDYILEFVWEGDVDAFFGLLVQFIIQILLIFQLLPVQCGFTLAEVTTGIIPAAAATVAIGNVAFGLHAVALQRKEVRLDVTALPDGANTVLVFAYVLSVMAPEFTRTRSAARTWEVGVFAAFMTGFLQILCLPLVAIMRRCIPRAALLSAVAGVSLAFLTMGFAFQVWENPLIALSPLFLVVRRPKWSRAELYWTDGVSRGQLICLGAGVQLPLHVPTGLGALLLGTCSAFVLFFVEYPMEVCLSLSSAILLAMLTLSVGARSLRRFCNRSNSSLCCCVPTSPCSFAR